MAQVGAFNGNRGDEFRILEDARERKPGMLVAGAERLTVPVPDHTAFTRQLSFRALQRKKNGPSQVRAVAEIKVMNGGIALMNLIVREEGLSIRLACVACRNLLHLPLLPLQVLPLLIFSLLGPTLWNRDPVESYLIAYVIGMPTYLCYLFFCLYQFDKGMKSTKESQMMAYLSKVVDYSVMDNYIQKMKRTDPSIWMHVRCWHLKHIPYGKGRRWVPETKYQTKKVYHYDVCTDVTPFSGLSMGNFSLVAVDCVLVKTMSAVSQRNFDAQYESLRASNRHRDQNTMMAEGAELSGLVEHYLVKAPGVCSIFFNSRAYFWACIFMLYIPYCLWFEFQTGAARLYFCKDITSHAEQAEATGAAAMVDPNLGGNNEATLATQPPVLDKWEWDARKGQYVAVYRAAGGGSQTMIARNSSAAGDKQAGSLMGQLRELQLQLQQGLIGDAEYNRARMHAISNIAVPSSHEAVPLRHAASLGPSAPSAAGIYGGQLSLSFVESSSTPEASGRSINDELQHLEDLRNNEIITQAMLEAERAKLLVTEIPGLSSSAAGAVLGAGAGAGAAADKN